MRNLILLIAILITGLVSAQNTINVNGTMYEVVNKNFNHVWNTETITLPFKITSYYEAHGDLTIDTSADVSAINDLVRRPFTSPLNEVPELWFYINGGARHEPIRINSGNNGLSIIGLRANWSHISMRWYWPNRVSEGTRRIPRQIGKEFWSQKTN